MQVRITIKIYQEVQVEVSLDEVMAEIAALDASERVPEALRLPSLCAALSAPLHAVLLVRGIASELVVSELGECEHVFLRLPDGLVLDPMADQFNPFSREKLPGVYFGAPALIHERAIRWPGCQEWHELMRELIRLYPALDVAEVGSTVSLTPRTLPPGQCEFTPATGK